MRISKLTLRNFKTFKNSTFSFSKITILAGANSAGKSTILNALSAIAQNNNAQHFPFKFHNYGENIHLGGFKDIINSDLRNKEETFSIKVDMEDKKNTYTLSGEYEYNKKTSQIQLLSLYSSLEEFNIKIEKNSDRYRIYKEYKNKDAPLFNEDFLIKFLEDIKLEVSILKKNENRRSSSKKNSNSIFSEDEKEKLMQHMKKMQSAIGNWQNLTNSEDERIDIQNVPEEYKKEFSELEKIFSEFKSHTIYIGPIRPYPSRHYYLQTQPEKIDSLGNNAIHLLVEWSKTNSERYSKAIADLRDLKLIEEISTNALKDELIEVSVTPYNHKKSVNISDVGFGLSQILPIVIANITSEKNSNILVNQPEVHLHPSCQAQLANYFAKESEDKNFIIETHSEYLINRFRLLVQNGTLKKENIKIIYIDSINNDTITHNITINDSGDLEGAPSSFFDTYYIDINNLILGE